MRLLMFVLLVTITDANAVNLRLDGSDIPLLGGVLFRCDTIEATSIQGDQCTGTIDPPTPPDGFCLSLYLDGYYYPDVIELEHTISVSWVNVIGMSNCQRQGGGGTQPGDHTLIINNDFSSPLGINARWVLFDRWDVFVMESPTGDVVCDGGIPAPHPDVIFADTFGATATFFVAETQSASAFPPDVDPALDQFEQTVRQAPWSYPPLTDPDPTFRQR